jgi:hypothetical protein
VRTLGELIDILGFDGDLFALELSVSLQGRHALSSFGLVIVQTPQLPVMLLDTLVAIVDNLSNLFIAHERVHAKQGKKTDWEHNRIQVDIHT